MSSPSNPVELWRIIYSSRLATDNREDAETAMNYIFRISEEKNAKFGICSMIYYNMQTFNVVQLLEGPKTRVEDTFLRILQDQRHSRVRTVLSQAIGDSEKWYEKEGLTKGSVQDFKLLQEKLLSLRHEDGSPVELTDEEIVDLPTMDMMPLAGDFDTTLKRLTYHSKLKASDPKTAFLLMQQIVEVAQKTNESLLIGGVLYLQNAKNDVFQCIEGPTNQIDALYSRINKDTRHESVTTVFVEYPTVRRYRTWGMVWASAEAKAVLLQSVPKKLLEELQIEISA